MDDEREFGYRTIAVRAQAMLEEIGQILTEVYCGDVDPQAAWQQVEVVLRGDPPEGFIIHQQMKEALRRLSDG